MSIVHCVCGRHELPEHCLHPAGESRLQPVQYRVYCGQFSILSVQHNIQSRVLSLQDDMPGWILQDPERHVLWKHGIRRVPVGLQTLFHPLGVRSRQVCITAMSWVRHDPEPVHAVRGDSDDRRLSCQSVSGRVCQLHEHEMPAVQPVRRASAILGWGVEESGRGVHCLHELLYPGSENAPELLDL